MRYLISLAISLFFVIACVQTIDGEPTVGKCYAYWYLPSSVYKVEQVGLYGAKGYTKTGEYQYISTILYSHLKEVTCN